MMSPFQRGPVATLYLLRSRLEQVINVRHELYGGGDESALA